MVLITSLYYTTSTTMELTQWQEKHLLEEEIKIFLEKEFVFAVNCCVHGYHIFKSFWNAPVGSVLSAKHGDYLKYLVHNKYDIALINSESIAVGHLPKFMSKLAHFFVKHAGKIRCEITDSKRYSYNLEQSGLEIPAKIIFQNSKKE